MNGTAAVSSGIGLRRWATVLCVGFALGIQIAWAVEAWTTSNAERVVGSASLVAGWGAFFLLVGDFARCGRRSRAIYLVGLIAACSSVVRLREMPGGTTWADSSVVTGGVLLIVVAVVVARTRLVERRHHPLSVRSPFVTGTFMVSQGGPRLTNHHAAVANQRFAVDVLEVRRFGRRQQPLRIASLDDFFIYGRITVSPVTGTVIDCHDGSPDCGHPHPAAGNFVRLEPEGRPGCRLLIAHLRPGTVAVTPGDTVHAGQVLGEVGNSGNSTEPHLHLHAEGPDGKGIPLRMERNRPLVRNSVVDGHG